MESTIELLAESQYHFIWRVDEIIKSSIEFSWDFELESDNVKTNFFYTVDLNGNKVLVIHFVKTDQDYLPPLTQFYPFLPQFHAC